MGDSKSPTSHIRVKVAAPLEAALAEARSQLSTVTRERDMWKKRAESLMNRRAGRGEGQVADFQGTADDTEQEKP